MPFWVGGKSSSTGTPMASTCGAVDVELLGCLLVLGSRIAAYLLKQRLSRARARTKVQRMPRDDLQLTHAPSVEVGMLIRRPPGDVFQSLVDPAITARFWF